MLKSNVLKSVVVIATFLIAFYGRGILMSYFPNSIQFLGLRVAYYYAWWILPTIVVAGMLFGVRSFVTNVGLNRGIFKGFAFAFVAVLPMLVSSAILGNKAVNSNLLTIVQKTLLAGFFEEYLFRGFLFGLLFLKLRWGFIPASMLGALIFGMGHIYQGNSIIETSGIFLITAMGAVWFAWLYIEWENNLWVPIFLHILMNLSWVLFDVSPNAMGDIYANVFRAFTIAITVIFTIRLRKKDGLLITRHRLLSQKNNTAI